MPSKAEGGAPVAIGAVGGSGTRIVAEFLRATGTYIGSDLNGANDNLWSALLFNWPGILAQPRTEFNALAEMFYQRMRGTSDEWPDDATAATVQSLATMPRPQHETEWLQQRAATFLARDPAPGRLWGWKVPMIHVVIDRLLEFDADLRYIHLVRHGLDMAWSRNQNQLRTWGSILLGRAVEITPRDSLAYWCAVQRRMAAVAGRYPDRVMFLDFDSVCAEPEAFCHSVLAFTGRTAPPDVVRAFAASIIVPRSTGRFRGRPAGDFDPADVATVAEWGYSVS